MLLIDELSLQIRNLQKSIDKQKKLFIYFILFLCVYTIFLISQMLFFLYICHPEFRLQLPCYSEGHLGGFV